MIAALATPEGLSAQVVVTQDVFRVMAGIEVESSAKQMHDPDSLTESLLCYSGGSRGRMVLELGDEIARAFASRIADMTFEELSEEDVRDVAGELINMIGGNLKALLPADTCISPPEVFHSLGILPWQESVRPISSLNFLCEFGPFRLRLYGA